MRLAGRAALVLLLSGTLAFLALPLVALVVEAPLRRLPALLESDAVQSALGVTLRTNLLANLLLLAFGTPAAYVLATRRFRGRAVVLTLVELPLVLPPAVAGIGLLAAFGAGGLVGPTLRHQGVILPFTEWAVTIAVLFVASPFYLRQAVASFEAVDPALVDAARTLGAGPGRSFLRIALPLAAAGLAAGWALAFARGIGEFGATLLFAGNVRGVTQTLPLAIYDELDVSLDASIAIGILLVVLSAAVLLSAKLLGQWTSSPSTWRSRFARSTSS